MKKEIKNNIFYIGVNDHSTDLFEGQYPVPEGMAYNSYLIKDEKCAVLDTADKSFVDQWLSNLEEALDGREPDYLIIHHMEPDHSAGIAAFAQKYPAAALVGNAKTFTMLGQFFPEKNFDNRIEVKNGDSLSLGEKELSFIFAPMVHWPEVMFSYEKTSKILFSADAFGKFGANDIESPWEDEARRYYIGIVGKYGMQVQTVLKKLAGTELEAICPLHGPVLDSDLEKYISLYDTWSSYRPEEEGVLIAYTSVYGGTKKAALYLRDKLEEKGVRTAVYDLARDEMSGAVADAFRFSKTVFATTTYNGDIYPFMKDFISRLTERNYQKRTIAFIENGSWASTAAKVMRKLFETSKEVTETEICVTIKSAPDKAALEALDKMAEELS